MFAFRLAHSIGCTVEELGQRMSAAEFIQQYAFDQLSPIGGERFDILNAMMCMLIANAWSKKRWKLDDFLPKWGAKPKQRSSSPKELLAWAFKLKQQQEKVA